MVITILTGTQAHNTINYRQLDLMTVVLKLSDVTNLNLQTKYETKNI